MLWTYFITLCYDNEKLTNSKHRFNFRTKYNIIKEFITLQLEEILTPKKIETADSKIKILSILSVEKQKNVNIIDELKTEGFQNFQQYLKINSINI